MTMTDNQPTQQQLRPLTGSERVKLFRKRRAKDNLLVELELLPTERDSLIRVGLLHKSHRSNKTAVKEALYLFLEKHLDPPPPARTEWALGEWKSCTGGGQQ
jgi:hypothetical protein